MPQPTSGDLKINKDAEADINTSKLSQRITIPVYRSEVGLVLSNKDDQNMRLSSEAVGSPCQYSGPPRGSIPATETSVAASDCSQMTGIKA